MRTTSSLLLYETYANEHFCLQDLTKISPSVRNSTPIIAQICLRLDIASRLHLDASLFAFILCFFTEKRFYAAVFALSPCPPRAHHAHRAHRSQIVVTISLFTVIRPTPFATCPSLGHPSQDSGKKHCALRLPSLGDQDRSPRSGKTIEPIGL